MDWLTLVVWLLTAVGGFALLGVWLQHGGMGSPVVRRFTKPLPFLHALAAVVSLVLFLFYIFLDGAVLKLITLVGLLLTAVLGIAMFVLWLGGTRTTQPATVGADAGRAPEDHFPIPLVAIHGIAAVATLILYIVAAFIVAS